LREELVALRRYFHQFPELSWEESHTAQTIAEKLAPLGLIIQKDVGGHGLIVDLPGELPGSTIAYRTDMDALPVQDTLVAPYCSMNLGVKHACGHDVHMAIAVGVIKLLFILRGKLQGNIRFIFQPAEEALDGAQAMIASGALKAPLPEAIFALHAFPLPVGTMGLTPGYCLAGMVEFQVKFNAPGTMLPDLINKTLPAIRALSNQMPPTTPQAFDALIARMRKSDDLQNSIYLTCWQSAGAQAGHSHVTCLASLVDYDACQDLQQNVRQVLDDVMQGTGTTYTLWTSFANPPVVNDAALIKQLQPMVKDIVGEDNVVHFNSPYPFSHEDFALYAQHIPAALLWLGTANPNTGIHSILHASDYDVDENALVTGTAVMTYLLLKMAQELSAY
jgi:metal-dependent amidase/aminoacylase/carboxypeptidase family protein